MVIRVPVYLPFPGKAPSTQIQVLVVALSILISCRCTAQTANDPTIAKPTSSDVRAYGATCDGVADDTQAFRLALAEARNVLVPPLTCVVSGITVPSGKALRGSGKSVTVLLQKPGSSGAVVTLKSASQNIELADFTIDGNAHNQSAANDGLAITPDGIAPTRGIYAGNHFTVQHLFISNTTGDCFNLNSPNGVDYFHDVSGFRCGRRGAYIQLADSTFSDLDFGSTGQEGIYCDAGCANNRFSAVKVWFTGSTTRLAKQGAGVYLQGVRNEFAAVETQNTAGDGILMYLAVGNILDAVRSESAGSNGEGTAGAVGIRFKNAELNHVSAFVGNGKCGNTTCKSMRYGIEFDTDGTHATSHGNIVSAVIQDPLTGDVNITDHYAADYNSILTTSTDLRSGTPQQWGTVIFRNARAAADSINHD